VLEIRHAQSQVLLVLLRGLAAACLWVWSQQLLLVLVVQVQAPLLPQEQALRV
jgi:hypothetical protein